MNAVDAAIVSVTVISCLFGLWRGLVKEVLSLLTWIAALLVARIYSEPLAGLLTNTISSSGARYVTAFALIFVVVMMLGTFINHLMAKLLTATGLKLADRILGGGFGIVRGGIIVLVILFIASAFVSETLLWQESSLIPHAMALIEWSRLFIEDMGGVNTGPAPGN
ncbi:MAG: CvpA family protein [Pseudohongiellaceae bacterium]|jgi:membrane protein required for colicin V production